MTISSTRFMLDTEHPDGHGYAITVENALPGVARLVVELIEEGTDKVVYQGADLTPSECRALANVLNNTAALVEADGPDLSDLLDEEPPLSSLKEWLESEFGGEVVTVMPSSFDVAPYEETYWVVFEHDGKRSIHWVVGLKTIHEGEGPHAVDCPIYFFDLVPVVNKKWRTVCRQFHEQG